MEMLEPDACPWLRRHADCTGPANQWGGGEENEAEDGG